MRAGAGFTLVPVTTQSVGPELLLLKFSGPPGACLRPQVSPTLTGNSWMPCPCTASVFVRENERPLKV
jgi:hypothetical protein